MSIPVQKFGTFTSHQQTVIVPLLLKKAEELVMQGKAVKIEQVEKLVCEISDLPIDERVLAINCFIALLKIQDSSLRANIVRALQQLIHFKFFKEDYEHSRFPLFLKIETETSIELEKQLSQFFLSEELLPILDFYYEVIERLALFTLVVKKTNLGVEALSEQKTKDIQVKIKTWIDCIHDTDLSKKQIKQTLVLIHRTVTRMLVDAPPNIDQAVPDLNYRFLFQSFGDLLQFLGLIPRALYYYDNNLKLLDSLEQHEQNNQEVLLSKAETEDSLGQIYNTMGENIKAELALKNSLRLATVLGKKKLQISAQGNLAITYMAQQNYPLCIETFQDLLTRFKGDEQVEQNARLNMGIVYGYMRQYDRAISILKDGLNSTNPMIKEAVLKNMGVFYCEQHLYQEAINSFTEAASIAATMKNFEALAKAKISLSVALHSLGKYRESLQCLEEVEAFAEHLDEPEAKEAAYTDFARAYIVLGKYSKAVSSLEKALDMARARKSLKSESIILPVLADVYFRLGEHSRAIKIHNDGLKITEDFEGIPSAIERRVRIYMDLSQIYLSLEKQSEASSMLDEALKLVEQIDDPDIHRHTLIQKVLFLISSGNKQNAMEAIPLCQEALRIAQNLELKSEEAHTYFHEALVYQLLNDYTKELELLNKSLSMARELEDQELEGKCLAYIGVTYRACNNLQAAEENFRAAIRIYNILQNEIVQNNQWRISLFEKQAAAYLELEKIVREQGRVEEALAISDSRRSRILAAAISRRIFPESVATGDEIILLAPDKIKALAKKMNTTFVSYSLFLNEEKKRTLGIWIILPSGEVFWETLPVNGLLEDIQSDPLRQFPYITPPAPPRPIRPTFRGGEDSFLDLTPLSYIAFLEEAEELSRGNEGKTVDAKPADEALSVLIERFKAQLSQWYETFISPIEEYLPTDPLQTLTIIPDGFLAQIPFAAFQDKNGKYLIEKHPLLMAPSIQVLHLLDQLPKDFSTNAVVVGNPTSSYAGSLEKSEKEAEKIVAPLLDLPREKILTQQAPTVSRIVKEMNHARWIHLACHGEIEEKPEDKPDPFSVFEGFFKLVPDMEHEKGYLHAQEIASLSLHAELVFLSACFSGRGKIQQEGSIGPIWSFLAAGALSTVATYWKLPDSQLTLDMVKTFYRHVLGKDVERRGKARALQKAMRQAIKTERENPHKWGAFFLSGLDFDRNVST